MNKRKTTDAGGSILGFIIFIIICVWIYNTWIAPDYSKPWWTGLQVQRICKIPYYDTTHCYTLSIDAQDKAILNIRFPNGGYRTIINTECSKAASGQGIDRICRVEDSQGDSWDVLKIG